MKKEYNIKDKVWLHLGESKLVEGRVVDIFDLAHVGYPEDREFYVIEIQTGIDNIFEVRDFDQLSPDSKGPINLFRKLGLKDAQENNRYLKKVGMALPIQMPNPLDEVAKQINDSLKAVPKIHVSNTNNPIDFPDEDEPTADQIHAAIEKSQAAQAHAHPSTFTRPPAKKRNYAKKRKPAKAS